MLINIKQIYLKVFAFKNLQSLLYTYEHMYM